MKIRTAFALLLMFPVIAGAATYKCQDASGRVTYTDKACAEGETGSRPVAIPAPPAPAPAPRTEPQGVQPRNDKAIAPYQRPKRVEGPPLAKFDASALPKDARGRPILVQTRDASLVLDNKSGRAGVDQRPRGVQRARVAMLQARRA